MKKRITFVDVDGTRTRAEVDIPAKDHLVAQQKFPALVRDSKKKKIPSKNVKKSDLTEERNEEE